MTLECTFLVYKRTEPGFQARTFSVLVNRGRARHVQARPEPPSRPGQPHIRTVPMLFSSSRRKLLPRHRNRGELPTRENGPSRRVPGPSRPFTPSSCPIARSPRLAPSRPVQTQGATKFRSFLLPGSTNPGGAGVQKSEKRREDGEVKRLKGVSRIEIKPAFYDLPDGRRFRANGPNRMPEFSGFEFRVRKQHGSIARIDLQNEKLPHAIENVHGCAHASASSRTFTNRPHR